VAARWTTVDRAAGGIGLAPCDAERRAAKGSDPRRDVYFETTAGGAVFSTGSITFCGSLSGNSYDNNVSRMLENVLWRFAGDRH
jgi:hypothetical protein